MGEKMRKIEDVKNDMRKLIDEAYAMGCVDGAIQGYIQNCLIVPDDATNGEMIKALFQDDDLGIEVIEGNIRFSIGDEWWNAPYKAESEK